jgi:GT2 family glycosyltransferase/glycosyltransferase involved in cell wall biosynthesis
MTVQPAAEGTLGEVNSALVLLDKQGGATLLLVGWVAHPKSATVLLEIGASPSELLVCSPEQRPDVGRLCPELDSQLIYGFKTSLPIPAARAHSSLFQLYGSLTLANGERQAISFIVSAPQRLPRQDAAMTPAPAFGPIRTLEALLDQRQRISPAAPAIHTTAVPQLSIIVHGVFDPRFALQHGEAVQGLAGPGQIEIIYAVEGNAAPDSTALGQASALYRPDLSKQELLNLAADTARGEFLLFLGSRSLLQPHSLAAAADFLRSDTDAGAVGARILSPAGELLEQGCKLSPDGNPLALREDRHAVSYRTDVDFVSRQFLYTRKNVFLRIGGFSAVPLFEADYCNRLRETGLRTVSDPAVGLLSAESPQDWFGPHEFFNTAGRSAPQPDPRLSGSFDSRVPPRDPVLFFLDNDSLISHGEHLLRHVVDTATATRELGRLPVLAFFSRDMLGFDELRLKLPAWLPVCCLQSIKQLELFFQQHADGDSGKSTLWFTPGPFIRLFQGAVAEAGFAADGTIVLDLQGRQCPLDQGTPHDLCRRLAENCGVPPDCLQSLLLMADVILTDNEDFSSLLARAGAAEEKILLEPPPAPVLRRTADALRPRSGRRAHWQLTPRPLFSAVGGKSTDHGSASRLIDVIIPIYNAPQKTKACIERVLQNSDLPYRLILVDDASDSDELTRFLDQIAAGAHGPNLAEVLLRRNDRNQGFVRSVNIGLRESRSHAVLLNSDTEVPPEWLSRLSRPMLDDPSIASCTPFSNSGTICTFPQICRPRPISEDSGTDEIDMFCRRLNAAPAIEIPTGVGFCMLLNRAAIDAVGMFDAEVFGRGYGEENDWCLRASRLGFRHMLTPHLFVGHHEGASFSVVKDRADLIESQVDRVECLWPGYREHIETFIQEDPIRPVREQLSRLMFRERGPLAGTLYVHNAGLGGGSALYLRQRLARHAPLERQAMLHLDHKGAFLYLLRGNLPDEPGTSLPDLTPESFGQLLQELAIDSIFVNQLVDTKVEPLIDLLLAAEVPIEFFVHDYYAACPSINLLNHRGEYCNAETRVDVCRRCQAIGFTRPPVVPELQAKHDIADWRMRFSRLLAKASRITAPSQAAADVMRVYYPAVNIEIEPHAPHQKLRHSYDMRFADKEELSVVVLGAIAYNKGGAIVEQLARRISDERLPFRLSIVGFTDQQLSGGSDYLPVTGRYEPEEVPALLALQEAALVIIPSIWPETFSYTTLEALSCGYPVLCFSPGGAAEQVRRSGGGWILGERTMAAMLHELKRLAGNRDEIRRRAQTLRKGSASCAADGTPSDIESENTQSAI